MAYDDFDLIEDERPSDVPPIVSRAERSWRCRAVPLGPAFGGLWAMTRGERQAAAFMALDGLSAAAWGAARPLMQISGLPLVVLTEGGYARVTDAAPDDPPALSLRPV